MRPIYRVELTEEEYRHLYMIAPEGIQAAMAASVMVLLSQHKDPLQQWLEYGLERSRAQAS